MITLHVDKIIANSIDITTGPVVKETTVVKYTAASGLPDWEGDIVGELTSSSIPNKSNIAEVEIGSHVTSLGYSAFSDCINMTSVTIPDSVTSIRGSAFRDCSGLASVTIGNGVTSIESYVFTGCNNSLYDTTTIPGLTIIDGWIIDNDK